MKRGAVQSFAALLSLCLLALPAQVFGTASSSPPPTADTVFFTGTNNKIQKVNSFGSCSSGSGGSASDWIKDNGKNFEGIAVRGDGTAGNPICIIAANTTQGGNLRMYNATTKTVVGTIGGIDKATAVALDTAENIFAVNDNPGGPDELWFFPRTGTTGCSLANYGPGLRIDSQVDGANQLADVKFARLVRGSAAYEPRDVLVLVSDPDPGKLLRYEAHDIADKIADPGGPDPTPSVVISGFSGKHVTGFALPSNGEILVATEEGVVMRFNGNGVRQMPDFASLPGSGVDIAVGLQGAVEKAFVTVHQGKKVFLYGFDGPNDCEGRINAQTPPHGVGNASLNLRNAAYTPQSSSLLTISPTNSQLITFEKTNTSGTTSGTPCLLKDPDPSGAPRLVNFAPCGVAIQHTVPGYVKAFDHDGPQCNPGPRPCPTFFVIVNDSNVDIFSATLEHHIEEEDFGFETGCYDGANPDPMQPRTTFCRDANDPPIVEGGCTDISNGCGSNIGRGGERSIILTNWDDRSVNGESSSYHGNSKSGGEDSVAEFKLEKLRKALKDTTAACDGGLAPFITNGSTKYYLQQKIDQAIEKLDDEDYQGAIAKLQLFIDKVRNSPGSFQQCLTPLPAACPATPAWNRCRNTPGELISRAISAQFIICGAGSSCNVYQLEP